MQNEGVQLIVTKLEELIRVAGGTVENLYPYAIKQAMMAGYLSLFGIIIAIVLFIIMFKILSSSQPKYSDGGYPTPQGVGMVVVGVVGLFTLIISTLGNITVLALFNPEFYAVRLLMNLIK